MVGAHQNVNGLRDLTTPLSEMIILLSVGYDLLRSTCLPNLKF